MYVYGDYMYVYGDYAYVLKICSNLSTNKMNNFRLKWGSHEKKSM